MTDGASPFKTPTPWRHQLAAVARYKDDDYCGLLFEQRCGKTAAALAIATHKFRRKMIDSVLVIAPNGIHRQWVQDAAPEHLPDDTDWRAVLWRSGRMETRQARADCAALLEHRGLRLLAVNVDALTTAGFRAYATKFFHRRRVLSIADESSDISNRSAERTKMALKIARRSAARMILDGTPAAAGPLGLFSQCQFLQPGLLGFTSYYAFRARYAELEERDVGERDRLCPACRNAGTEPPCPRCGGSGFVGKHQIQVVKRFLNVDELRGKLETFSTRVLRSDCHDLPPKVRQKVYFDLPREVRAVYDELRARFLVELRDGSVVTAPMVLTRYLRLQQVASGYLPGETRLVGCPACAGADPECQTCEGLGLVPGADAPVVPLGPNARLAAFDAATGGLTGQGIVWCRFTPDVDAVLGLARERGLTAVRYDGLAPEDARAAAVRSFQKGDAAWFVGSAKAGGRGLDLSAADWVAYYSHDWSLRTRLQSEDRAQAMVKTTATLYLDVVCNDSIDEKIVAALRAGKNLSDLITGDRAEAWL